MHSMKSHSEAPRGMPCDMKPTSGRTARLCAATVTIALAMAATESQASTNADTKQMQHTNTNASSANTLDIRQQAIIPIAAHAATGNISALNTALNQGLEAGLTLSDAKEVLVQVYAYAGFPRSLNALGELMRVVDARKQRGVQDAPGSGPKQPIPKGEALLEAGTANQTKLSGAPVKGPLFDFAPAIDEYLKTHLFGDIFARDNLDWQSREIATVSMLSAMAGVESQLQSHMRISMNTGLNRDQLQQLAHVLAARVDADAGRRATQALEKVPQSK